MPAAWPAGFYTVSVLVQRPSETYRRTTNQLSFSLAPSITITPNPAPAGSVTFTVTCNPEVWPEQSVSLLLGDQDLPSPPVTAKVSTLAFTTSLVKGEYFVRLRVDGVDSLLVNRSVTPPVFDPTQKVTMT